MALHFSQRDTSWPPLPFLPAPVPTHTYTNTPVPSTPFLQVLSKRLQHLAAAGLLQREKPEASQLMVTASNTLPDQLLTIIQVSG